jgi:hypothetical protein
MLGVTEKPDPICACVSSGYRFVVVFKGRDNKLKLKAETAAEAEEWQKVRAGQTRHGLTPSASSYMRSISGDVTVLSVLCY